MNGRWRLVVAPALAALLFAALATPSQAAFPGQNGKIAFVKLRNYTPATGWQESDIWIVNSNGSGETRLTQGVGKNRAPAWSPDGQKIAFESDRDGNSEIYVMSADGTGQTRLTTNAATDGDPTWSPDGTKLAFVSNRDGHSEVYAMNSDGSGGATRLTTTTFSRMPTWSPGGNKIAFTSEPPSGYPYEEIYAMGSDGSNPTRLTNGGQTVENYTPNWSPDGQKIAWAEEYQTPDTCQFQYECIRIMVMNADGSGVTSLSSDPPSGGFEVDPAWSPSGSKIVFVIRSNDRGGIYTIDPDGSNRTLVVPTPSGESYVYPDWQPIPINAYPRPKGATPFLTYLVPAYNACTSPNRTHGPSLAFGSCAPPTQVSNQLTIGTADSSNGKPTKSISSVRFETVVGNPLTPGDQADVAITAVVTDVYTQAGLADYAGTLTAKTPLRITDKLNTPHPGGPGAGTVSDIPYGFTIPCAVTSDTTIGGACLLSTSADALAPGAVREGKRSIWALGQVAVYDANDDPFMKQGIFVP